jgi:NAD(P)-dependent dehydrogenase (short-subunit alcohol dehydrogenase family)
MSALSNKPRCVLVTGAAKRLGREIALHLATHGWGVALHYRHSAAEAAQTLADCQQAAAAAGHSHDCFAALPADLADEAQARALVPQAVAALGRLDAVVNSASIFEEDEAHNFSHAALLAHMATNTAAPVILAQALHQHLHQHLQTRPDVQAGAGCVVNLLDQKLWNLNPDFFSYTLSKAALEAANTMLAMALAPLLRVVGVAPGLTLTAPMLGDEQFKRLHTLSPLGQSSRAQDIAHAVQFALDNRAITGTSLLIDGGQHLMRFERDFSKM